MTVVTDPFTRANESPIGGNWSVPTGMLAFTLTSNQAREGTTGAYSAAYWNANTFGAAQYAKVTLAGTQEDIVNFGTGPACFIATGADTMYYAYANSNASGEIQLAKAVAGVHTEIAQYTAGSAPVAGDTLEIRTDGAGNLSVYHNGILRIGPIADASIASGRIGMWGAAFDFTPSLDDFEGGDLAAAASVSAPLLRPVAALRSGSRGGVFLRTRLGGMLLQGSAPVCLPASSGAPTFQPAWAKGSNVFLGSKKPVTS